MPNPEEKTMIGVLASHDSVDMNNRLSDVFETLYAINQQRLAEFHFLFTGGTFDRMFATTQVDRDRGITGIRGAAAAAILNQSTRLPSNIHGGVNILSYLVVRRQCRMVWVFLTPLTAHLLHPDNLALLRLCIQSRAKTLLNIGSILEWFDMESEEDVIRDPQTIPLNFSLSGQTPNIAATSRANGGFEITTQLPRVLPEATPELAGEAEGGPTFINFVPQAIENRTIALIAHDAMKPRMVAFAQDYESQLARFQRILATGHTGSEVESAAKSLVGKILRCHSGPEGGDIEITTEILFDQCHAVIFFIDPLHPHPHPDDIRVVLGAGMIHGYIRILVHEMDAREWMDRVVRKSGVGLRRRTPLPAG